MKKLLLISLLILCAGYAYCGDDEDDDTKRPNGFRIGYNRANLVNSDEKSFDNLDAFYFGIVRQKKIAPLFRIETGIEYMQNGAKVTEDSKVKLAYLVLPIQFKAKLGPFIGQVGLNGNFKVYQKNTVNGTSVILNDDNKASFFDLAGNVGVGINILFLTVEGRYYWGFIDVKNDWFNEYGQLGLKFNF